MKYYIVFQGKARIDYLRAPIREKGKFFHKNILDVQKGDLIFISEKGMIVAYAFVKIDSEKDYEKSKLEKEEYYRTDLEVNVLTNPFELSKYKKELDYFKAQMKRRFPYDKNYGGNQGYLYEIPKEFTDFINSLIEEKEKEDISNFTNKSNEIEKIERKELTGRETEIIREVRANQGTFRRELLKQECKCKLCELSNEKLLIASHIKPWCKSNKYEKLDRDNGFLFCPQHDSVFDKFFITFKEDGRILISEDLSKEDRKILNLRDHMQIEITEGNKKYLDWHREEFTFKNNLKNKKYNKS